MQILRAHAIKKADNIAYAMALIVALLCLAIGFGTQIDDMLRAESNILARAKNQNLIKVITAKMRITVRTQNLKYIIADIKN